MNGHGADSLKIPTATELSSLSPEFLQHQSHELALNLFRQAAQRVPAYKKFLKINDINPSLIKTVADFNKLPYVNKKNYLQKYSLDELVWDGDIGKIQLVARSSGSSGHPFYWPSMSQQKDEVEYFYDLVFKSMFNAHKKSTLTIIGYGMGTWVAGTATLLSTYSLSESMPMSVVTPGYNKSEIVEIIKNLGKHYDQIVLCAYPPLIKEVIDTAVAQKVKLKNYHLKFVFGAEAITEEFRDYIFRQTKSNNPLLNSMNTIGSADAMVLGHETPLSIAIRRAATKSKSLALELFKENRMPTLAQYYPWQKHYSTHNGELLITANNGIPLLRYNIHDQVDLHSYNEMTEILDRHKISAAELLGGIKTKNSFNWRLPFLSVYGKSDNTVKFYGAFVYPENIKSALETKENARQFSGKFFIDVYDDPDHTQRMRIDLELAPGIETSTKLKRKIQKDIVKITAYKNTEYKCVLDDIGNNAIPSIELVPYGTFKTNIKHRYANATN